MVLCCGDCFKLEILFSCITLSIVADETENRHHGPRFYDTRSVTSYIYIQRQRGKTTQGDTLSAPLQSLLFCYYFHAICQPQHRIHTKGPKLRPALSTYILSFLHLHRHTCWKDSVLPHGTDNVSLKLFHFP